MKQVVWLGDSLARLRDFPQAARHEAGVQLGLVQAGAEPSDWKPMPSVGLGVNEIRVRAGGAFRVIHMAGGNNGRKVEVCTEQREHLS